MKRCIDPAEQRGNGSANGPLRAVVRLATVTGRNLDLLECGHLLAHAVTWIGGRSRNRRRCGKCKHGAPVDVAPSDFFRQPGDRDD